jgi:hypothetical protein
MRNASLYIAYPISKYLFDLISNCAKIIVYDSARQGKRYSIKKRSVNDFAKAGLIWAAVLPGRNAACRNFPAQGRAKGYEKLKKDNCKIQ